MWTNRTTKLYSWVAFVLGQVECLGGCQSLSLETQRSMFLFLNNRNHTYSPTVASVTLKPLNSSRGVCKADEKQIPVFFCVPCAAITFQNLSKFLACFGLHLSTVLYLNYPLFDFPLCMSSFSLFWIPIFLSFRCNHNFLSFGHFIFFLY